MAPEKRDVITRWAAIGGIIVAMIAVQAYVRNTNDDRYVQRSEYNRSQAEIAGKLQRLLDVACLGHDAVRACRESP